jgi:hypothetical protein
MAADIKFLDTKNGDLTATIWPIARYEMPESIEIITPALTCIMPAKTPYLRTTQNVGVFDNPNCLGRTSYEGGYARAKFYTFSTPYENNEVEISLEAGIVGVVLPTIILSEGHTGQGNFISDHDSVLDGTELINFYYMLPPGDFTAEVSTDYPGAVGTYVMTIEIVEYNE